MMGEKEKQATYDAQAETDEEVDEVEEVEIIDNAEEAEATTSEEDNGLTEKDYTTLQTENKALKDEVETMKERLLRVQAEYENYRKRTEKERIAEIGRA